MTRRRSPRCWRATARISRAAALTNPSGFAGLDGIFRLLPSGLVQRGLAVLEVHRGAATVLDPAPNTFEHLGE